MNCVAINWETRRDVTDCTCGIKVNSDKTRMTAFIKTTLKKSDDQTNIDIYRVAANIQNIILYQN